MHARLYLCIVYTLSIHAHKKYIFTKKGLHTSLYLNVLQRVYPGDKKNAQNGQWIISFRFSDTFFMLLDMFCFLSIGQAN
jgi:hypothetical protein